MSSRSMWCGGRQRCAWSVLVWVAVCAACDGSADSAARDKAPPSGEAELYAPLRVLEVEVELAASDWDLLRHEGRTASQIVSGCAPADFEYTRVPAVVTIEGARFEGVEVRKKGYLGSLSSERPSLKIDLTPQDEVRSYQGSDKITLNNNLQDASRARTCLAYGLFAQAGVPTPRCNFAHVTVNGADLGFYSHVEGVDKPFLARVFGDDSGNLYEGQGADFRPDLLQRFEKKTHERDADTSDLQRVVSALQKPDAELLDALAPVVDVDAFLDFWATEVLVGHWDGYNGNLNNYYVYTHPGDGRLRFVPWGTDGTFGPHAFYPDSVLPSSVLAAGELSRRLYAIESMRERYRSRLRQLLDDVWDEAALAEAVQRIGALSGAPAVASDALVAWIEGRRARLVSELDATAPNWSLPPRAARVCEARGTALEVRFATAFSSIDDFRIDASANMEVQLQGEAQRFGLVLSSAGPLPGSSDQMAIRVLGRRSDNSMLLVQIMLPPSQFAPGSHPTHGLETAAFVIGLPGDNPADFRLLGFADTGVLVLDRAGVDSGAVVSGRFEAIFTPAVP